MLFDSVFLFWSCEPQPVNFANCLKLKSNGICLAFIDFILVSSSKCSIILEVGAHKSIAHIYGLNLQNFVTFDKLRSQKSKSIDGFRLSVTIWGFYLILFRIVKWI